MTHRLRQVTNARDKGFTLIELLVVIIIIGILAAIAIPVFLNQRKKAIDGSLRSDVKAAATTMELWLTDNHTSAGTTDRAVLRGLGFKATPGDNEIFAAINPTRLGYCIVGRNVGDSTGGALDGITYDSLSGGLLNGGKSVVITTSMPGACGLGNTGGVAIH